MLTLGVCGRLWAYKRDSDIDTVGGGVTVGVKSRVTVIGFGLGLVGLMARLYKITKPMCISAPLKQHAAGVHAIPDERLHDAERRKQADNFLHKRLCS